MASDNTPAPAIFRLTLHPDGPTRLVSFDTPPQWAELAEYAARLFHLSQPTSLRASYVDAEGDTITLDSDSELALFYANAGAGPFRFTILEGAMPKEKGKSEDSESSTEAGSESEDSESFSEDALSLRPQCPHHSRRHRRMYGGRHSSHGVPPSFPYHHPFHIPPPPPFLPSLLHLLHQNHMHGHHHHRRHGRRRGGHEYRPHVAHSMRRGM